MLNDPLATERFLSKSSEPNGVVLLVPVLLPPAAVLLVVNSRDLDSYPERRCATCRSTYGTGSSSSWLAGGVFSNNCGLDCSILELRSKSPQTTSVHVKYM